MIYGYPYFRKPPDTPEMVTDAERWNPVAWGAWPCPKRIGSWRPQIPREVVLTLQLSSFPSSGWVWLFWFALTTQSGYVWILSWVIGPKIVRCVLSVSLVQQIALSPSQLMDFATLPLGSTAYAYTFVHMDSGLSGNNTSPYFHIHPYIPPFLPQTLP